MDDYIIHVGMSMRLMAVAQESAQSRVGASGADALVVGYPHEDTVCAKPELAAGTTDVATWSEQCAPALPNAVAEADAVAKLLGCTALTGASATKEAVLKRLQSASVIHLATHGMVDDSGPRLLLHGKAERSVYSDQFLRAGDIMQCKPLSAQLVVLAACNSGRGEVSAGEGVVGLARAFVAAGASAVLVSLWKLPDKATSVLMERLYTKLVEAEETQTIDIGSALRRSMQETVDELKRNGDTAVSEQQWGGLLVLGGVQVCLNATQCRPSKAPGQCEMAKILDIETSDTSTCRSFYTSKGTFEKWACEALGFEYIFNGQKLVRGNGLRTVIINHKEHHFITEDALQQIFGCCGYYDIWMVPNGPVIARARALSPKQHASAVRNLQRSIYERKRRPDRDESHEAMLRVLIRCVEEMRALPKEDEKSAAAQPSESANRYDALLCDSSDEETDDEEGDEIDASRYLEGIIRGQYRGNQIPGVEGDTRGNGDGSESSRKRAELDSEPAFLDLPLLEPLSKEQEKPLKKKLRRGKQNGRLPDCDGRFRCGGVHPDCIGECQYRRNEPGVKPEDGYPVGKATAPVPAFKQHIYAIRKHPTLKRPGFDIVTGPYKDRGGNMHFGQHSPSCQGGDNCLGMARGMVQYVSPLETEPESDPAASAGRLQMKPKRNGRVNAFAVAQVVSGDPWDAVELTSDGVTEKQMGDAELPLRGVDDEQSQESNCEGSQHTECRRFEPEPEPESHSELHEVEQAFKTLIEEAQTCLLAPTSSHGGSESLAVLRMAMQNAQAQGQIESEPGKMEHFLKSLSDEFTDRDQTVQQRQQSAFDCLVRVGSSLPEVELQERWKRYMMEHHDHGGDLCEEEDHVLERVASAANLLSDHARPSQLRPQSSESERLRGTGMLAVCLEMAYAAHEHVAKVSRRGTPGWASAQMNLGLSSASRERGDRAEHIENAIRCYKLAMTVWTRGEYPLKWANTRRNLGNAYKNRNLVGRDRGDTEVDENFRLAVKCHTAALKIYTQHGCEEECHSCQINLQNVESAVQARKASSTPFAAAVALGILPPDALQALEAAPALKAQLEEVWKDPIANTARLSQLISERNTAHTAVVQLKGLAAAQHNGKRGTVVSGPDTQTGRYEVQLDDEGTGAKPLGLKPANLRLLKPPLEPEFDSSSAGAGVRAGDGAGAGSSAATFQMLFKRDDEVKLQGLSDDANLNGQHGTISSRSKRPDGRWPVRLNNRQRCIAVRPTNLLPCALAEAFAAAEANRDQQEMRRIRELAAAADMVASDGSGDGKTRHVVSVDERGEYTIMHGSRVPIYLPTDVTPIITSTEVLNASRARILVLGVGTATELLDGTDHQRQFVHSRAAEIGLDQDQLQALLATNESAIAEVNGAVLWPFLEARYRCANNKKGQLERLACEALGFGFCFQGKSLAVGNGLEEKDYGSGKLLHLYTANALQEVFESKSCNEYVKVWSVDPEGPVMSKAKTVGSEARQKALECLGAAIHLRERFASTSDSGHAEILAAQSECHAAMLKHEQLVQAEAALSARVAKFSECDTCLKSEVWEGEAEASSGCPVFAAGSGESAPQPVLEGQVTPDSWDDSEDESELLALIEQLQIEPEPEPEPPVAAATRGGEGLQSNTRKRSVPDIIDLIEMEAFSESELRQIRDKVDAIVKKRRRTSVGRQSGSQSGRLPDCDGRYRCRMDGCPCEYKETGKDPVSGYPRAQGAYRQHLNSLRKKHGGEPDDYSFIGFYQDSEGRKQFGQHAPSCPCLMPMSGGQCLGPVLGLVSSSAPRLGGEVPGAEVEVAGVGVPYDEATEEEPTLGEESGPFLGSDEHVAWLPAPE
jgi:hypothetical protein